MIVGSTILYLDGNTYYSPEFPRGGLAATFAVDVTHVALSAGVSLVITVEHRNHEDTTWSSLGSFSGISATGTGTKDLTGVKESVRFAYAFAGGTPSPTDAVHLLMQSPSWRPY